MVSAITSRQYSSYRVTANSTIDLKQGSKEDYILLNDYLDNNLPVEMFNEQDALNIINQSDTLDNQPMEQNEIQPTERNDIQQMDQLDNQLMDMKINPWIKLIYLDPWISKENSV